MKPALITPDYAAFLTEVKGRIHSARLNAGRAVNRELVLLYWDIGRGIVEKQQTAGWGDAVVERLAGDLRAEFPDMRGFSQAMCGECGSFSKIIPLPNFSRRLREKLAPTKARLDGTQFSRRLRENYCRRSRGGITSSCWPRSKTPPPGSLPPRHGPVRLDPRRFAESGQSRGLRAGGDGEEDAQLRTRAAGASGGAGGRDAEEPLQSGIPRHRASDEGAGTGGPADRAPAAVHSGTGLRLLLRGPAIPAGAGARRNTSWTCCSTTASSRRWWRLI